ncbi:MAG: nucleoside deaminase [Candidatus Omnitrophica bacterium]|nr:nucleoside deaminase [Candidatus Omnitrophota bacterium]
MRRALHAAEKNLKTLHGGPFGACVVKNGRILAVAANTVFKDNDPSAHAEINAIRLAARRLGDWDLSGCQIYSTCEPCPMCFSAIHWARIDKVVYGAKIVDARKAGFNELAISCHAMKKQGKSKVKVCAGLLRVECRLIFERWGRLENNKSY